MQQVKHNFTQISPFVETFSSINKLHKQVQAVFPLQSIKETHPQIQQMTQHHDLTNAIRALTETIRTPLITQLEYLNYHLEGIKLDLAWMGDPCACFREIGKNLQKSLQGIENASQKDWLDYLIEIATSLSSLRGLKGPKKPDPKPSQNPNTGTKGTKPKGPGGRPRDAQGRFLSNPNNKSAGGGSVSKRGAAAPKSTPKPSMLDPKFWRQLKKAFPWRSLAKKGLYLGSRRVPYLGPMLLTWDIMRMLAGDDYVRLPREKDPEQQKHLFSLAKEMKLEPFIDPGILNTEIYQGHKKMQDNVNDIRVYVGEGMYPSTEQANEALHGGSTPWQRHVPTWHIDSQDSSHDNPVVDISVGTPPYAAPGGVTVAGPQTQTVDVTVNINIENMSCDPEALDEIQTQIYPDIIRAVNAAGSKAHPGSSSR